MVSLRDIAAICGVSVPTVSKALRGRKDVGEETRARILKTAQELGYVSASCVRSESPDRSHNLGILFPGADSSSDPGSRRRMPEYHAALLESFRTTAETKGYCLTFLNTDAACRRRPSLTAQMRRYHLDGICMVCADGKKSGIGPEISALPDSGIPLITADCIYEGLPSVCADHARGMQDLVQYACSRGHSRIAFLHGPSDMVTEDKLAGFRQTCAQLSLTLPEEYLREIPGGDSDAAFRDTCCLLRLPEPPTCILCADDHAAIGVMTAIRSGKAIPSHLMHDAAGTFPASFLSVAGYGGLEACRRIRPRLTTVRPDTKAIGAEAALRLISGIEQRETPRIEHLRIPGILLRGETIKRIPSP